MLHFWTRITNSLRRLRRSVNCSIFLVLKTKQKGFWHRVSIITTHLGTFWRSGERVFQCDNSHIWGLSNQCQPKQQWIDDFISNDLDVSYFTALSSDCLAIISTWNFYSSVVKAPHNDTPNPALIQRIWIWKKSSQQTSSIKINPIELSEREEGDRPEEEEGRFLPKQIPSRPRVVDQPDSTAGW